MTPISEQILNCLGEGVIVVDQHQRIIAWNVGAQELLGWEAAEVLGKTFEEAQLFQENANGRSLIDPQLGLLNRCLSTGLRSRAVIAYCAHKDGYQRSLTMQVLPLLGDEQQVVGAIELLRDEGDAIHQLEKARQVQRHLVVGDLPPEGAMSFYAQYLPNEIIGGDFYRVQLIEPGIYGMMVADATGHGIPAALYTTMLATLWGDFRTLLYTPAGFMNKLNQQMCRMNQSGDFFTALYGVIDLSRRSFIWACAGHTPPIIWSPDNAPEKMSLGGVPLGLEAGASYGCHRAVVGPGTRILMLTDGVFEIQNTAGKMYGVERLLALLDQHRETPGEALLETIPSEVNNYAASDYWNDDLTLLLGVVNTLEF